MPAPFVGTEEKQMPKSRSCPVYLTLTAVCHSLHLSAVNLFMLYSLWCSKSMNQEVKGPEINFPLTQLQGEFSSLCCMQGKTRWSSAGVF